MRNGDAEDGSGSEILWGDACLTLGSCYAVFRQRAVKKCQKHKKVSHRHWHKVPRIHVGSISNADHSIQKLRLLL